MQTSRLLWIGLIFILSGMFFIGGLLYLQDISLKKSNYTFTVIFDNVRGLNVGDQVDMLGKKIGKVSKTSIMGQKIAVELSINNSFVSFIPIDSKIEVKSEGLIGSKFISITPGINRKDYILPGAKVEGLREFDFSEITPGIVPLTQDLSAFARQLKATLGVNERDNIRSIIQNIESFTMELDTFFYKNNNIISDKERNYIKDFIKNLNGAVKDLKYGINKEISKIDGMLDDLKQVTDKSDEISSIISELNASTKTFNEILKKLDPMLDKVEKGEGSIGKLVNDESFYDNLNNLAKESRLLIKEIKDNPTKYMKAYRKSKK